MFKIRQRFEYIGYILVSPLERQLENSDILTVKSIYNAKSYANEQLKSVKGAIYDMYYLVHVAQMNGEIDANYSQRPHTFLRNAYQFSYHWQRASPHIPYSTNIFLEVAVFTIYLRAFFLSQPLVTS